MEYKIGKEARCAVIGYGSWATAIVGLLAANEARVGWYVRNPEVLEGLLGEGRNPRYLSDVEFDRRRIALSDDLDEVVREADIVILATPSAYLKTFLEPLTVSLQDKFVVSAIKGIVPGDYKTIVEYVHDRYDLSYKQIGIITGPSHAEEVSRGKLSYLTVVCTDPENAQMLGEKVRHGLHSPELLDRPVRHRVRRHPEKHLRPLGRHRRRAGLRRQLPRGADRQQRRARCAVFWKRATRPSATRWCRAIWATCW